MASFETRAWEDICSNHGVHISNADFSFLENEIFNFIEEIPDLIERARTYAVEKDVESLENTCQQIYSYSESVGAYEVIGLVQKIQEFCRSGEGVDIEILLEQLDCDFREAESFFTSYIYGNLAQAA